MTRTVGSPTVEQVSAVRDALEAFFGLGRYGSFMPVCVQVGHFEVRWDTDYCQQHGANGLTEFFSDGSALITLRLDREPDEIRRTMAHELTHVRDARHVLEGASRTWLERRAEQVVATLPRSTVLD